MSDEVHAAGGLVVRDGRVLLVHRPRYDDWSLPKGKLEAGESFEQAALREVAEETGLHVRLGPELAPARYADARGRPKLVRYWEMTVVDDEAAADEEVDELAWLEPGAALERCSYPHDRELVAAWARRGTEVERKFLVSELPAGLEDAPRRRIEQGYLVTGEVEVRLRRVDGATLLTIKAGSGLARAEEELEIEADRFERLWPLTEGRRVEKVRHVLPAGERTIELDRFAGAHEGLVLAEVEFPGRAEAEAWTPPGWLGEEVTGDPAYANAHLAC